ncbi:unnamed protein product [Owenia fusiformis]|uniref:3-phosphoshikimate 1-carboxyvinyltransferase n=1 Tax=Owenia fusiformis TaxID=6347 RepID=A0A8J1XVN1_OWEFU|nr:unnamed protein product [Owenia fusiformis]
MEAMCLESIELIQLGLVNSELWNHLKYKTKATYLLDESWMQRTLKLVEEIKKSDNPLVGGLLSEILQRVCNIKADESKSLAISHIVRLKDESGDFITPYTIHVEIRLMLQNYEQPLILNQDNIKELLAYFTSKSQIGLNACTLKCIGEPYTLKITGRDMISVLTPVVEIHKRNVQMESLRVLYAPGSKSETNRALLMAALSKRIVTLVNILESEDTALMMQALKRCGVIIHRTGKSQLTIQGNCGVFEQPHGPIYLGNSGTSMRFLTAAIALNGSNKYILEGNERMSKRPIADLVDALNNFGCNIEYVSTEGYPPLRIMKRGDDISDSIDVKCSNSSQFISGVLMGISTLKKIITINAVTNVVSKSFVNLTVHLMRDFGINIEECNYSWKLRPVVRAIDGNGDHKRNNHPSTGITRSEMSTLVEDNDVNLTLKGKTFDIETRDLFRYEIAADATSCSYLVAMAALTNQPIHIPNLISRNKQGDAHLLTIVCPKFGLDVKITDFGFYCTPSKHGVLKNGGVIDVDSSDMFITFAVLAAFAEGETKIINIKNQAIKECSRIKVTAENLRKAGVDVIHDDDSITIVGKETQNYNQVTIECHNDHRIAMGFAVFAYRVKNVKLSDSWCVEKTFPYFWQTVKELGIETFPTII